MSGSNALDVATFETIAEKDFASKDMLKAESKGTLAAIRVDRRDTFVANDGIASANIRETDAFPSHPTQEDLNVKFDNFIKQVKAGSVEVTEIYHRHIFDFMTKQLEYGDCPFRLTVHAGAGTGKGFWVANTTLWLKNKYIRHEAQQP